MAINIYTNWNVGSNNSNTSLSGVENDTYTGLAHVSVILCIPCTSHTDRVLQKSMLWITKGEGECQSFELEMYHYSYRSPLCRQKEHTSVCMCTDIRVCFAAGINKN